jgi:hypothetical protein
VPTDLAALLVDEGAVSADAMERAVARHREAGGALDTALLELGLVDEPRLVDALSRAAELPPAPASAWDASDPRARRVFPSRVAERHGLAPFALDGRELALVATHPVDLGLLDEISFMLSLHLTAHVAPEWRVRGLIQRLYGGPLDPRLAALAGGGGSPVEAAASAGPAVELPRADAAPSSELSFDEPADAPRPPPARASAGAGFPRDASQPLEPLAAALAEALESEDLADLFRDDAGEAQASITAPEPIPPPAPAPSAARAAPPRVADEPAEPEPEDDRPPDRTAPPRWSLGGAQAALAAARSRDEVVLAALRYARDFFEFAAMFAVTRDAVAGHDALGTEDARDRCRGIAIYTTDPGLFRTVIDTRAPHLGPMARGASGNEAILDGLGRGAPRTTLVFPVLLRDRAVCVLYADNGEAPVSPRRLGDLLLVLSTVGPAFERVIRDRKKSRRSAARAAPPHGAHPPPPPARPEASPARAEPVAVHAEPGDAAAPAETWAATPAPELAARDPEPPPAPADDPWRTHEPARVDPVTDDIDIDVADEDPAAARAFEPAAAVAELVASAPGSAARAETIRLLAAHGDEALPALLAALPGPAESDAPTADPAALGPVPAALAALGASALPALLDVAVDRDAGRRRAAVVLLGATKDSSAYPALADAALDGDAGVAAAGVAALDARRRDPAIRPLAERLRRALLSGVPARAACAARALGALRDAEAIPLLVQLLEAVDRRAVDAAAEALAAITLQRLGADARGWLAWWKEHRGRGRAEWLFSGLTSADREVRVAAAAELVSAATPPVAYSPDAPAADRESAARAWAGWWARSGRIL